MQANESEAMLAVIFIISVTNMALGFGLAVALHHGLPWRKKADAPPPTTTPEQA
jgi:hypothetical protein